MPKKNVIKTSKDVASEAAKVMQDQKLPKEARSIAASALVNRKKKTK